VFARELAAAAATPRAAARFHQPEQEPAA
jgi:hypothetical protein